MGPHAPGAEPAVEHDPSWPQRIGAEAIGTAALVFVAAGADAMAELAGGQIGPAARAVAPGLLIAALVYAIGDRSGAHFNPAVSLGFALRGLFPARWLAPYWAAQVAGALGGALVVRALFGTHLEAGVTSPKLVDAPTAVALEAILTGVLITVIIGTADRFRVVGPNAALAVGGTIALAGLIALPIEGASMNPARSLGPAVVSGSLGDIWIYVLGPALGAVAAVALARFLHGPPSGDAKSIEAAEGQAA